jgi:hypothetical protein
MSRRTDQTWLVIREARQGMAKSATDAPLAKSMLGLPEEELDEVVVRALKEVLM